MFKLTVTAAALAVAFGAQAQAQDDAEEVDAATPAGLSIELNAATTAESGGCTMSFLIENGHDAEIAKAVFETVLFDTDGQVERLTLFDFGELPEGRPRVRQFTIPGKACDGFGRILFNGASTCEAGELGDAACTTGLILDSRTDIEVLG
ncbi:hypothetical protein SAMN04488020_11420 [Palleronia marisminoris]|uniref:Tat pathway signal sequence domain protein n=1 Tax=Palleronia marisminoris TaxID=315423 RepID=A0A1Y5TLI0_9RHOB|nr:hypothetical protein [Palleronia marisminoris]SFH43573.1 hypothetical protein SAMN04488020_11420 [Palleronia marisminoris]SLN66683.1 hypothetical protein PAM7066_03342 [Palleronia marisminoris]